MTVGKQKKRTRSTWDELMKFLRALLLLVCVLGSLGIGRAGKQRKNRVGTDMEGSKNDTTIGTDDILVPSTTSLPERSTTGQWRWKKWWKKKEDQNEKDAAPSSHQQPVLLSTEIVAEVPKQQHHQKKKKKKRRPKSGKQKIANCRHLTSLSTTTAWNSKTKPTSVHARLSRLWRKLPLQKYVTPLLKKYATKYYYHVGHRALSNNTTTTNNNSTDEPTTTSNKDMSLAYAMGVVATLSYWDFHKKALPDNRSSFELLTLRQGIPKPLQRRRKRDKAWHMAMAAMRVALDEASPWLSLLPQRRTKKQQTSSYRDKLRSQLEERLSSNQQQQQQQQHKHHIQLEYFFYNWYEPTPLGNYHDTDLILASCNNGKTLIVAFAGTASVPDTVTNLQTFEPVQHSGLFHHNQKALKGSIHRGFLNAYSRVERGSVLRLCDDESNCTLSSSALHRRYSHCIPEKTSSSNIMMEVSSPKEKDFDQYDIEAEKNKSVLPKHSNDSFTTTTTSQEQSREEESIVRKRGRRGCKVKDKKLMTILRELVVDYLTTPGRSVLLAGHSLGGSLATLHALDIIINFPNVPVNNLEVWTFGGAQVSDDAFLESALAVAPRLQHFLQREQTFLKSKTLARVVLGANHQGRSQFHRFVSKSLALLLNEE
jgi:Lipase (class 3)